MSSGGGLTVVVTGPTGDIGRSLMAALERSRGVARIEAMARRPFDPRERGWRKTRYRQGDVLDEHTVRDLVEGADVVVHLAFLIMGDGARTRAVNLEGSRRVFEAATQAGVGRLLYASSVAAYGFRSDHPPRLTEDVPATGTSRHYYSEQKAQLEALLEELVEGSETAAYVFRPCIVAGADALALIRSIPRPLRRLARLPVPRPVIPDAGIPFQLVHHDDVAAAMRAAVLGRGQPGAYNLAGPGELTLTDLATELGWHAMPVPRAALDAAAEVVARTPLVPAQWQWIESLRHPVLMDSGRARRELRWRPRHDARQTLAEMVAAAGERGLLG